MNITISNSPFHSRIRRQNTLRKNEHSSSQVSLLLVTNANQEATLVLYKTMVGTNQTCTARDYYNFHLFENINLTSFTVIGLRIIRHTDKEVIKED